MLNNNISPVNDGDFAIGIFLISTIGPYNVHPSHHSILPSKEIAPPRSPHQTNIISGVCQVVMILTFSKGAILLQVLLLLSVQVFFL